MKWIQERSWKKYYGTWLSLTDVYSHERLRRRWQNYRGNMKPVALHKMERDCIYLQHKSKNPKDHHFYFGTFYEWHDLKMNENMYSPGRYYFLPTCNSPTQIDCPVCVILFVTGLIQQVGNTSNIASFIFLWFFYRSNIPYIKQKKINPSPFQTGL